MLDLTEWFRCLSDTTRLRILLLLADGRELCVCDITSIMIESQPKISRHLAFLRNLGVLTSRRQGQWVYYQLAESLPDWAHAVLAAVVDSQPDAFEADRENLQRRQACSPDECC